MDLISVISSNWKVIGLVVLVVGQGYYIIKKNFSVPLKKSDSAIVKGTPNGVVYLNVLPGSGGSVSSSPACIKLAAYCRIAGIPHEAVEADFGKAPNHKVPYIVHNGNIIGDSQLIIRYLENTYSIDETTKKLMVNNEYKLPKSYVPFSRLSAKDQSMSDLIRSVCEGELYWGLVSIRWLGAIGIGKSESLWYKTVLYYFNAIPSFLRGLITNMLRANIYNNAYGQGLSRHSPDDQIYLIKRDLTALSQQLGKNLFFLGNFPSECDCAAFGILEALCDDKWPNEINTFIKTDCANLLDYQKRIKSSLFHDVNIDTKFPPSKLN